VLGCTARRQPAEHPADCGLVVWDGLALASRRAPFRLEHERRRVPDALDEASRQAPHTRRPRTGVAGKDLEFERRAAAVEGQDDHGSGGDGRYRLGNFGFDAGQRARGSCDDWSAIVSLRTATVAVFCRRRTRGVVESSRGGWPAFFDRSDGFALFLAGISHLPRRGVAMSTWISVRFTWAAGWARPYQTETRVWKASSWAAAQWSEAR
jgi:hypothetical protein